MSAVCVCRLFTSTLLALTSLSANVTLLGWPVGEAALLDALSHFERYDIILIDTYSSDAMDKHGFMKKPEFTCRLRALDYCQT